MLISILETHKAATALPQYGSLEGPDLQDVLTHSSTLLTHLSTALYVFTDHTHHMRGCYKRIREREEALDELRRRRRATGAKSENAEKKLAKMGPENKGLPQQTELLERLRIEMRQVSDQLLFRRSCVDSTRWTRILFRKKPRLGISKDSELGQFHVV